MEEVKLQLNEKGRGSFYVGEGDKRIGEMEVGISGGKLVVYHTEVSSEAEGKGVAKKLLEAMVDYARSNGLGVVPLCVFVLAQFKKNPDKYADIWMKMKT